MCTAKGSKCIWNDASSSCGQSGSADAYVENRCNSKAATKAACDKWTSCTWNSTGNGKCNAASAAARAAKLSCSTSGSKCECKKPKDITTMPMYNLTTYNYTEGNKSYLLPDSWGGKCHSWEADSSSSAFVGAWGCNKAQFDQPNHWCNDIWLPCLFVEGPVRKICNE